MLKTSFGMRQPSRMKNIVDEESTEGQTKNVGMLLENLVHAKNLRRGVLSFSSPVYGGFLYRGIYSLVGCTYKGRY